VLADESLVTAREDSAKLYAVRALAKVDEAGKIARGVLTKLLNEADPELRREVAEALKKLNRSRRRP